MIRTLKDSTSSLLDERSQNYPTRSLSPSQVDLWNLSWQRPVADMGTGYIFLLLSQLSTNMHNMDNVSARV